MMLLSIVSLIYEKYLHIENVTYFASDPYESRGARAATIHTSTSVGAKKIIGTYNWVSVKSIAIFSSAQKRILASVTTSVRMGVGNAYASKLLLAQILAIQLPHSITIEMRDWTVVIVRYQEPHTCYRGS